MRPSDSLYYYECEIRKVVDGDTFVGDIRAGLGMKLEDQRFRLWAIDTPEENEPGYQEAKEFAKKAIEGKKLIVQTISDKKDKWGRWLVKVFLSDWRTLNDALVAEGLARRYGL